MKLSMNEIVFLLQNWYIHCVKGCWLLATYLFFFFYLFIFFSREYLQLKSCWRQFIQKKIQDKFKQNYYKVWNYFYDFFFIEFSKWAKYRAITWVQIYFTIFCHRKSMSNIFNHFLYSNRKSVVRHGKNKKVYNILYI